MFRYFARPGTFESLEPRNLLSGHCVAGLAGGGLRHLGESAIVHDAGRLLHAVTGLLTADLSDAETGATGKAQVVSFTKDGATTTLLKVSVTGAAADSDLDVAVNGTVIGTLHTNAEGNGKAVFSSAVTEATNLRLGKLCLGDVQPLPADLALEAGAQISVDTTIAGALVEVPTVTSLVHLKAKAEDETTGFEFKAQLTSRSLSDGSVDNKLAVYVEGAEAGAEIDVIVDGVTVGTLTANDQGEAKAVFATNPHGKEQSFLAEIPAGVAAGSSITVGGVEGTLDVLGHLGCGGGGASARFGLRR